MVREALRGAGLFAAIAASAGVAQAADLAVKAPAYKAAPVILSDWSGFYIGGHGGYGWGDTSIDTLDLPRDFRKVQLTGLNASPKGGVFGGQAGYNWQYGQIVTGLEIDFSGADLNDSGNVGTFKYWCYPGTLSRSVKFDELATARTRLGYTVLPNLLAYGTAGLAWGHSELSETASVSHVGSATESAGANSFGWAAGAGLEYKLFEHVIVRGEYLHYDFGKTTYSLPSTSVSASTSVDVARGGVSYKF